MATTTAQQNDSLTNAVTRDHAEILSYYNEYCKATGNRDIQERWANQLIWQVARHSVGEEIVVYPLFEKHLGQEGHGMAEHDREKHWAVKKTLHSLGEMTVGTEDYNRLLQETMSILEKHIKVEETNDLPLLEQQLGTVGSRSAAASFTRTKHFAPTRPHLWVPSKPPFETVLGLMNAPLDKLKDVFSKFPTAEMMEHTSK